MFCPELPENLMIQGSERFADNYSAIKLDIEYCIEKNDPADCASEEEASRALSRYPFFLVTRFLTLDMKN